MRREFNRKYFRKVHNEIARIKYKLTKRGRLKRLCSLDAFSLALLQVYEDWEG